jgi:LPXTG-site transpeptidase (sortase) family protein
MQQIADDLGKFLNRYGLKILIISIFLIGVFLITYPLLPKISFEVKKAKGFNHQPYTVAVVNNQAIADSNMPSDNRLVIPSIGLDSPILEGQNESTVNGGVWRRPNGSEPSVGGNTVMVGHRFRYFGDASQVFYNLDKVNINDQIIVFWDKQAYKYQVQDISIVSPNNSSVEAGSSKAKLTLYTCTPIWTSKNRLVITAYPS